MSVPPSENPRRDALEKLPRALDLPPDFTTRTPTARLAALLALPDPAKVVRRLRPDEFYQLINGIGLEDAHHLLPYGTSEQRKAYVDIDAWSGWRFQPRRLDRILEVAREVSSDFAMRLLNDLDPEVIALRLMTATVEVLTTDEVEARGLPDEGVVTTPDGTFALICKDPEDIEVMRRWLDLLYAWDQDETYRILHALRRETPATLEEDAFRFRDARLQDLGFPGAAERFEIFEPFDLEPLKERLRDGRRSASRPSGALPLALSLSGTDRGLFFWTALEALADSPRLPVFITDLLYLVNRVLGVRTEDWFEADEWTESAAQVLRWVSVGLEALSAGDPEEAARIASLASPVELFRAGVQALRPAHVRARKVVAEAGGSANLRRFDEPTAAMLHALAAFPPKVADEIEPFLPRDPLGLADVARAERVSLGAEAVVGFARQALGFDTAAASPGVGPSFASVVATAWARGVLSGSPSLEPLSGEELRSLRAVAFDGARIRPALRRPATTATVTPTPGEAAIREFLGSALDKVEEALGGLDPAAPVDLRFVGDALIVQ